MDDEGGDTGPPTMFPCGYCGNVASSQLGYMVVNTLIGAVRLCDRCAAREPYAYAVAIGAWIQATAVPKRWRAAQERANRGKHD